jgi:microsomal prostaglandin-E synthase 2
MMRLRHSPLKVKTVYQGLYGIARLLSSRDSSTPSVTLFQYAICPFCNKAKALLAYAGIEYTVVEVNPLTKAEVKPWSGDYRKVPIAIIEDEQVNGSHEIMTTLLKHPFVVASLESKWNTMSLHEFTSSPSAARWSKYANDDLAPLLYPNICRSLSDSYAAFSYVNTVDTFSSLQKLSIRSIGSLAMYFAASKIKTKRGITDEQKALDKVLTEWEGNALDQGKLFASGTNEPNMGDLAVFGTLRAVEGLPAHSQAVGQRGVILPAWYDRMKEHVYNKRHEKYI